ncbi:DBH-like monooxygenase protein 1 homolog [Babylonia areolata]|uniref:DBH-like monooxygenase protein 1 homolog n=1 Tax=Babylonia areolata TaxID=304850 RepID=UPI003FD4DC31
MGVLQIGRWRIVVTWALCVMQAGYTRQVFVCEEIQDPSVETTEVVLPPVNVAAQTIGRQCSTQLFPSPSAATPRNSDNGNNNSNNYNKQHDSIKDRHHLVAYTPVHGAANVSQLVRRMFLHGCQVKAFSDAGTVTKDCEDILKQTSCHLIGAWSPGYHGDCFHRNTGIRMGTGGYTVFVLEVQWDNNTPRKVAVSNAGFTLYHTSQAGLRDSSMLKLGNDYVIIPPRSLSTDVTSTCTAACTSSLLKGEVSVTAAFSRLNLLGIRQEVTVYRGGEFLLHIFLTNLTSASGGRQFNFQEPLSLKPGDVIHTKCRYTSLNKTRTTFSSLADVRDSETCYAYLRFHPSSRNTSAPLPPSSFLSCVSWRSLLACDPSTEAGCSEKEREKFRSENLPMTRSYNDIIAKCPVFGVCTEECKDAVGGASQREACLSHPDSWTRVKVTILSQSLFGRHFLSALASCELRVYRGAATTTTAVAAAAAGKGREKKRRVTFAVGSKRGGTSGELQRSPQSVRRGTASCRNNGNVPLSVFTGCALLVHAGFYFVGGGRAGWTL